MRPGWKTYLMLVGLVWLGGCRADGPGTDSLTYLDKDSGIQKQPFCVQCHYTQEDLDPRIINGKDGAGSHIVHLVNNSFSCKKCHGDFYLAETHFNGSWDTTNSNVNMVLFDQVREPDATWENDTGAGTGSCANTSCHAPAIPDWYNITP